jgi:uncharacterized repeat protein (TIGR03803 family)
MNSTLKKYVRRVCSKTSRFLRNPRIGTIAKVATRRDTSVVVVSVLVLALALPALAQTESVIYSFANPPDAYSPKCNLVRDTTGNMYGTTFSGGTNNLGAVFMVTPNGTESVVYSFAGGADGSHPVAGLFRDAKTGTLYGTTVFGGANNMGTVFMLNPATGAEVVLYSFKGGLDGANPYSSVVRAGTTIFGTTYNGGAFGYGTVFKLTSAGKEAVLHSFNSAFPTLDGSFPYAGLVLNKGILYGTTTLGGAQNLGTVFSISKTGTYALLYSFKGGSQDGQGPNGGVAFDKSGNLYGTTYGGGVDNAGVVYRLTGAAETVLHHFARNSGDGINPYASLIFVKGNFYGTTLQGGSANGGTVFKMTPAGAETVLHAFTGGADGFNPYSALVLGANNTFYSTTFVGGTSSLGTVFKLIP